MTPDMKKELAEAMRAGARALGLVMILAEEEEGRKRIARSMGVLEAEADHIDPREKDDWPELKPQCGVNDDEPCESCQ